MHFDNSFRMALKYEPLFIWTAIYNLDKFSVFNNTNHLDYFIFKIHIDVFM